MKKFLAAFAALLLAGCLAMGAACTDGGPAQPSDRTPSGTGGEIVIPVPEATPITPVPDPPAKPAAPQLPAVEEGAAPYIGAVGWSDGYEVTELGSDGFEGVDIFYPKEGETLPEYSIVWFDVYNYRPGAGYDYVRFDFLNIVGAEKVSVSAAYLEGYDTAPAPGILVESLLDGELSFVADLANVFTVNASYGTTTTRLNTQTVCRLFVYLDSNPAQNPTDETGSLTISAISFHKEGDPATEVDNSPAINEVTAVGSGYTLKTPQDDPSYAGVFTADYAAGGLSDDAYVSVGISRFTGAYGRIRIRYTSSNVSSLTVSDGSGAFSGTNEETGAAVTLDGALASPSGCILVDIRGKSALNEIRFYIDSHGSGAASFELISLELIYTPFATAEWDATSKFHMQGAALGGKITATYDEDVGWDHLDVPVRYWTPEFSTMVVKFRTWGTAMDSVGAEKYGIGVNSSTTVVELAYNPVKALPYDEATGEYTATVNLSGVSRIAMLNFYFDSQWVEPFAGTRTVEITSIDFYSADSGPQEPQLGGVTGINDIFVEKNDDGSYDATWAANKADAYVTMAVIGLTSDHTKFTFTAENIGEEDISIGVYWGGWSICWLDHTVLKPGERRTFTINAENIDGTTMHEVYFFLNYAAGYQDRAGSVRISDCKFFIPATPGEIGALFDTNSRVGLPQQFAVEEMETGTSISWQDGRDTWAKVAAEVTGFDEQFKYLRVDIVLERDTRFCVCHAEKLGSSDVTWYPHTVLTAGEHTLYIEAPDSALGMKSFFLTFFFDSEEGVAVKTGSAVITHMEFLSEMPAAAE